MNAMMILPVLLIAIATVGGGITLFVLVVRALLRYLHTKDAREDRVTVRQSLAETLRAHRLRCKMTQEFVAEAVGVSRQAVSKWENGSSDPSTANLIALAKLYGVSAEELLRGVEQQDRA